MSWKRLLQTMIASVLLSASCLHGQLASHTGAVTSVDANQNPVQAHRTHLILKDGSYQLVMSYKVLGDKVSYVSAERAGEIEEIPLELVDLAATKKWEERHNNSDPAAAVKAPRAAPVLDPELAKEEADRLALTAEVAPDLHLEPQDSVLALDTYRGTPELVPLQQSDGDLNRQTGHSVLRGMLNPNASQHQVLQLKGEKSTVQMHVNEPAFFIRMDDATSSSGEVMTVDTHGASSAGINQPTRQKAPSHYAIVRVDVRQDARIVASFTTSGNGKHQEDVVATTSTLMPGGHWAKLVPAEPLLMGEYCLIEVLAENQINLSVWDFGVHPTAPENRDVLLPVKRKNGVLERRPAD